MSLTWRRWSFRTTTNRYSSRTWTETSPSPSSTKPTSRTHAVGSTWGDSPAPLLALSPSGFQLILLADTLWFSSGLDVLIESILALLDQDPAARVELVACFHSGRETVRAFLREADARGLV